MNTIYVLDTSDGTTRHTGRVGHRGTSVYLISAHFPSQKYFSSARIRRARAAQFSQVPTPADAGVPRGAQRGVNFATKGGERCGLGNPS